MLKNALLVLAFACLALAAPNKPTIATQFESEVGVFVYEGDRSRTLRGGGFYAFDVPKNRARRDLKLENEDHQIEVDHILQRYDLGAEYIFEDRRCNKRRVSGAIPNPWSWLSNATYNGTVEFQGRKLDNWLASTTVNATLTITRVLGVLSDSVNTPVWYSERTVRGRVHDNMEITFFKFNASEPQDWAFTVPNICDNSTAVYDRLGGDVNAVVYFANTNWNCADVACSQRVPAGSGQENYACAEFAARSLAAGSYIPGLASHDSSAAYGNYKGYNLRVTTSLSSCLGNVLGFKKQAANQGAINAAYPVFGDGGDGYFSHACIGVSSQHIDCHNNARYQMTGDWVFIKGIDAVWGP
eukprot:TRINITY_DN476_c0_g1_i3.p1 TRINITY_DN476_c0_g1~~TRINITY_DN476_c0_g1_i3.p1  ORF type:complete len:385 (-),score=87.18 TRINITY_DN476_c0_g1_i3:127-1194(-)